MTALLEAAIAPADESAWHPMDPMDRSWSGVAYTRAFVDLDVPTVARVRDAVRLLTIYAPETGVWCRTSPPQWRPVGHDERERWLDAAVHGSDLDTTDIDAIFELNAEPLGELPFRFLVGPSWISVRMTHALGDGFTVNAFVGHVLRVARTGEFTSVPWTVVPARRRDVLLARDVARRPGAIWTALRHRRQLAGGDYEPASRHADALVERTTTLVGDAACSARLRGVRTARFPQASASAVAMVGLRAAFAAVLPTPRPGFECLFNTRSAADGSEDSWGNWSAGVFLRPADDLSPESTSAAMRWARDAGLPALSHASLRARAGRASSDAVQVSAPAGAPRLTMSFVTAHAVDPLIPGLRAGRSFVGTITRPNGIESITVQAVELAGRLGVSVSYYPAVWARDAVEGAVRGFLADPVAVLAGLPTGAG